MIYRIDESTIAKSIKHYGAEIQSTVCMEECSELIQAISKMKRSENDKENLTEEIADVLVCIETLKQLYSVENSAINNWIRQKQQRQLRRMKNE
jgi:NTP pyrophosphatase (non-canonical NTP hydrolase)